MISLDLIREFDEFRQSPPGTTICPAPLMNLHFSQLGVITACCFNRTLVLGVYPENSLEEIWNGAPAQELRDALARNDLSKGCEKCLQQIEARDFGGSHAAFYSIFSRHLERQQRELGIVPAVDQSVAPMPMKLEFNIHNSCNLECIMCHGLASSSIARNRENLPALPNPYDNAFVDQLEPYLAHVVEADFMGGEPFLIPSYRRLWDRIARVNPKTRVLILTNGTVLDDEVKALLERLNCSIHMSIDSDVEETYEAIRKGASYDRVMANADYYGELMQRKGQAFIWRYCPMRINWRELPDTARRCNEKGILLHFNQVDSPINFSLNTLPRPELEEVVRYLEVNGPTAETSDVERGNRIAWVEMVVRLRGFLDPKNRGVGLGARLDTAAAVVTQYSAKRADSLKKRLTLVDSQSALTEAAKSFVITKLSVEQAISTEAEVPGHVLDRLAQRTSDLFRVAEDVPVATFARIFLNETVRTFSGVWGVYTPHDEQTFDRVLDLAGWIVELENAQQVMSSIVHTPPAELYRLLGFATSLDDAKARFVEVAESPWQVSHERGDSLLRSGHFEDAVAAYEVAIRSNPMAVGPYVNMGHALCNLGRWADAARAYVRARGLNPEVSGVCQNLGDVFLRLERYADAVEAYRSAVAERPEAAACHVNMGHALGHLGRWDEAIAAYSRGVQLTPGSASPVHELAHALTRASRWEEAAEAYRCATVIHAGLPALHMALGHVLCRINRWDEAIAEYRRAMQLDPTTQQVSESLANALLNAARYEESLAAHRKAIREQPRKAALHVNLGQALSNLNRWDEAAAAYKTGIDLAPDNAASRFGLGDALWRCNRLEDAIAAYREAVRCDPDSASSHVRLAEALGGAGHWEQAVISYGDAVSRQPESAVLHACVGNAFGCLAQWDDAAAAFHRAVARQTNGTSYYASLATALACANRHEEAIDAFQSALRAEPDSAVLHVRFGGVLRALERWDEALAEFRTALRIDPLLPEARGHFADVLSATGHLEEAVVAYEHSVAQELECASKEGRAVDTRAVSVWFRRRGDTLIKLHRWDDAAAAHQSADDLNPAWTRSEPGPVAEHVQKWVESGWPAPSSDAAQGTRTMFVLDSDYGELTTVMLMLFGQEISARATLVLSERLYVSNRDILPGRTHPAASLDDIVRAVEREKPDVVFLCSAYLFSIHGLLSLDELEQLVSFLDKKGCRAVTMDPFLGLLSGLGKSTTIAIDIPENATPELRRAKEKQDQVLLNHLSRSHDAVKRVSHLYPSYPAAVGRTAEPDPNVLSFYNAKLVCPPSGAGRDKLPGAPRRVEEPAAARPRWLFVLASRDYEAQIMFHGREYFIDVVVRKIEETLRAGRHPVVVAPYDLIQGVIAKMQPAAGVTLFTFCPFKKFVTLLVDAEFAFYWNVVSHTMLLRLMNHQPVFMFDRGHLVRNVTPLYERVVDWYYQGREPMYLRQDDRLDLDELATLARSSAGAWEQVASGFSRAPSPSALLARLAETTRHLVHRVDDPVHVRP